MEEWKQCGEGKKVIYFVSNQGRIKSVTKAKKFEKILNPYIGIHGYCVVNISKKSIMVHTLVILHFIGSRPKGLQIDHINRNKTDNRIENLRYCTRSENNRNTSRFRTDILEEDSKERCKIFSKESNKKLLEKDYWKKYQIVNKNKISEKRKENYTCICGLTLRIGSKIRHEKTLRHQAFVNF
jgi:hypothetical protein